MRKIASIVAAGVLVLLGAGGCASATVHPQYQPPDESVATLTGFASVAFIGGTPSGPVTVRITGTAANRLAVLVSQLPSVSQSQVHCEEPLGLMYRIDFGTDAAGPSKTVVDGYRCDAAVTVTVAGRASSWRRDSTCRLIRAVRQALPVRARATRSLDIGCGS
jgi:hypothetical protein